jgi:hypothetical protein
MVLGAAIIWSTKVMTRRIWVRSARGQDYSRARGCILAKEHRICPPLPRLDQASKYTAVKEKEILTASMEGILCHSTRSCKHADCNTRLQGPENAFYSPACAAPEYGPDKRNKKREYSHLSFWVKIWHRFHKLTVKVTQKGGYIYVQNETPPRHICDDQAMPSLPEAPPPALVLVLSPRLPFSISFAFLFSSDFPLFVPQFSSSLKSSNSSKGKAPFFGGGSCSLNFHVSTCSSNFQQCCSVNGFPLEPDIALYLSIATLSYSHKLNAFVRTWSQNKCIC